MTNRPVIHKVSRHDDAGDSSPYIVLRISWRTLTADTLQFQATENENAYFKEVQASNFIKLKAKTYKGSEEEFLGIIRWVLLAEEEGAVDGDFEMSAAITGKTLNVGPSPPAMPSYAYRPLSSSSEKSSAKQSFELLALTSRLRTPKKQILTSSPGRPSQLLTA